MATLQLFTFQVQTMIPGCSSFSWMSLSWPISCAFLLKVCMLNLAIRDLQPGLTEQAEDIISLSNKRKQRQTWRGWMKSDTSSLTSLGQGSWGRSSWHHGVEEWKSAGSWANSLQPQSTDTQMSRRTGTASAPVCLHGLTYLILSAPRWHSGFWEDS